MKLDFGVFFFFFETEDFGVESSIFRFCSQIDNKFVHKKKFVWHHTIRKFYFIYIDLLKLKGDSIIIRMISTTEKDHIKAWKLHDRLKFGDKTGFTLGDYIFRHITVLKSGSIGIITINKSGFRLKIIKPQL